MSKSKKLVYVSEDLINEAMETARSEGKSLGVFVEDSLRLALSAKEMGYDTREASKVLEAVHANRILGGAFVPLDVFNHLIRVAYRSGSKRLKEKWYKSGVLHGKYLNDKFEDPIEAFKTFLETSRWDLGEVEVREDGETVRLRCFSTVLTKEGAETLLKYIEGAFNSMGYRTVKSEYLKGIIILEFRR